MPLGEQMYCTQQMNVPPRLPMILKQFCKAAIRTQPYDLLRWSSTYFRALADGEEPPVKLRLEYPPPSTESGLTLGFLKVLLRQFGDYNKILSLDTVERRWNGLCLDHTDLELINCIGKFRDKCEVIKFLGIATGLLGNNLRETMILICELFTHEPDGGSGMIPVNLFMDIYSYLAGLECEGDGEKSTDLSSSDTSEKRYAVRDSQKFEEHTIDTKMFKVERVSSGNQDKKQQPEILKIHPQVPGIGPRVQPNQITVVATWINECAELQEGMVGPRNIRHFQCPAMDKYDLQP